MSFCFGQSIEKGDPSLLTVKCINLSTFYSTPTQLHQNSCVCLAPIVPKRGYPNQLNHQGYPELLGL